MAYLYLKQKVFSIGEKYTFYDENQNVIFTSKGSFFKIPKRYQIFSAEAPETPIVDITRAVFAMTPQFQVKDPASGNLLCKVNQRFRLGSPRFNVETPVGMHEIIGKILAHDFKIEDPNKEVILTVKRKWISWGDTYEIFFNPQKVSAKIAAALVLTIDCAIHSNNSSFGQIF